MLNIKKPHMEKKGAGGLTTTEGSLDRPSYDLLEININF